MNHISNEFLALRRTIIFYSVVLFSVFAGLLVFPVDGPSFAGRIFLSATESLIPPGVQVVTLGPVAPFVAPIALAFLVAILTTFPVAILLVIRFLRPALRRTEQRTLSLYIIPSFFLFYSGCALAYLVIIPDTFRLLYSFATPIGVAPFFALDDFISSVFFLTLSVGFAFLLPVGMAALSRIGIIPAGFWFRHWRGAVVFTIIFSSVITPDGSGVTMAFLSVPLLGLYAIGAIASVKRA